VTPAPQPLKDDTATAVHVLPTGHAGAAVAASTHRELHCAALLQQPLLQVGRRHG
jgi:hypothetical protein